MRQTQRGAKPTLAICLNLILKFFRMANRVAWSHKRASELSRLGSARLLAATREALINSRALADWLRNDGLKFIVARFEPRTIPI